jgi:hypothetical protein
MSHPALNSYRKQYVHPYFIQHGTHQGMLSFSQWLETKQ